jgi:hypothetical protein
MGMPSREEEEYIQAQLLAAFPGADMDELERNHILKVYYMLDNEPMAWKLVEIRDHNMDERAITTRRWVWMRKS